MAYKLPKTHAALLRELDREIELGYCEMQEALTSAIAAEQSNHFTSTDKAYARKRSRLVTEDVLRRVRVCQAMREVVERRKAKPR